MKQLVDGLSEDLEAELHAVSMLRLYCRTVQGPYREGIRAFLANEITGKLHRAQILSDTIGALGGTAASLVEPADPVPAAKAVVQISHFSAGMEGSTSVSSGEARGGAW